MKTNEFLGNSDWLKRFHEGEASALRDVYHHFSGSLFQYAKKIVGSDEDAKDLISDVFIKLYNRRLTFAGIQNIKAFLFVVTKNACLSQVRKTKRIQSAQKDYEYLIATKDEAVINKIILNEFLELVYKEIEALPEVAKKVFRMKYILGLDTNQIAQELNMHPKVVRNNKDRALELLKIYLLRKDIMISTAVLLTIPICM